MSPSSAFANFKPTNLCRRMKPINGCSFDYRAKRGCVERHILQQERTRNKWTDNLLQQVGSRDGGMCLRPRVSAANTHTHEPARLSAREPIDDVEALVVDRSPSL